MSGPDKVECPGCKRLVIPGIIAEDKAVCLYCVDVEDRHGTYKIRLAFNHFVAAVGMGLLVCASAVGIIIAVASLPVTGPLYLLGRWVAPRVHKWASKKESE